MRSGPWASQTWDLIVDLGKSSEATEQDWRAIAGCQVLRLESFRDSIEDLRVVRRLLRAGQGVLLDSEGLDWWELTGLLIHSEVETMLLLCRLVERGGLRPELFATRDCWQVNALAHLANAGITVFNGADDGFRIRHYLEVVRSLRFQQLVEIFFDKFDGGYRLRGNLSAKPAPSGESRVLLPSAYTNVSRTASAFAQLLPEQEFLLVATRRSGLEFEPPQNVKTARLAQYASGSSKLSKEQAALVEAWPSLLAKLRSIREFDILSKLGVLDSFPNWFQNGIRVREAWKAVFVRERISAVLCGDDSNWYTRLPVVLARRRGLPTVDFHHGAFDGRFLLKSLPSDVYLAKNEAERDYLVTVCRMPEARIVVGSPPLPLRVSRSTERAQASGKIVYFSEPYEVLGGRAEEVYRELLPQLCRLATVRRTSVVLKLHPFESVYRRHQLVERVLPPEHRELVEIVTGPLTGELFRQTWFGITVESTAAADCTYAGVPCFLCAWLVASHFGYVEQYARFGIGKLLWSGAEISGIPEILAGDPWAKDLPQAEPVPLTAETLRGILMQPGGAPAPRAG